MMTECTYQSYQLRYLTGQRIGVVAKLINQTENEQRRN